MNWKEDNQLLRGIVSGLRFKKLNLIKGLFRPGMCTPKFPVYINNLIYMGRPRCGTGSLYLCNKINHCQSRRSDITGRILYRYIYVI